MKRKHMEEEDGIAEIVQILTPTTIPIWERFRCFLTAMSELKNASSPPKCPCLVPVCKYTSAPDEIRSTWSRPRPIAWDLLENEDSAPNWLNGNESSSTWVKALLQLDGASWYGLLFAPGAPLHPGSKTDFSGVPLLSGSVALALTCRSLYFWTATRAPIIFTWWDSFLQPFADGLEAKPYANFVAPLCRFLQEPRDRSHANNWFLESKAGVPGLLAISRITLDLAPPKRPEGDNDSIPLGAASYLHSEEEKHHSEPMAVEHRDAKKRLFDLVGSALWKRLVYTLAQSWAIRIFMEPPKDGKEDLVRRTDVTNADSCHFFYIIQRLVHYAATVGDEKLFAELYDLLNFYTPTLVPCLVHPNHLTAAVQSGSVDLVAMLTDKYNYFTESQGRFTIQSKCRPRPRDFHWAAVHKDWTVLSRLTAFSDLVDTNKCEEGAHMGPFYGDQQHRHYKSLVPCLLITLGYPWLAMIIKSELPFSIWTSGWLFQLMRSRATEQLQHFLEQLNAELVQREDARFTDYNVKWDQVVFRAIEEVMEDANGLGALNVLCDFCDWRGWSVPVSSYLTSHVVIIPALMHYLMSRYFPDDIDDDDLDKIERRTTLKEDLHVLIDSIEDDETNETLVARYQASLHLGLGGTPPTVATQLLVEVFNGGSHVVDWKAQIIAESLTQGARRSVLAAYGRGKLSLPESMIPHLKLGLRPSATESM